MVDAHDDRKAGEVVEETVDAAGNKIQSVIEKSREKLHEGYEKASQKAHEGYEKASQKAHEVWDQASDMSIKDAQGSLEEYIRRNPAKSMIYAATAGLVIGLLVRGRNG